jgi:hypothetical protein
MRLDDRVLWRVTVPPGVSTVNVSDGGVTHSLPVAAGEAGVWYACGPAAAPVFSTPGA